MNFLAAIGPFAFLFGVLVFPVSFVVCEVWWGQRSRRKRRSRLRFSLRALLLVAVVTCVCASAWHTNLFLFIAIAGVCGLLIAQLVMFVAEDLGFTTSPVKRFVQREDGFDARLEDVIHPAVPHKSPTEPQTNMGEKKTKWWLKKTTRMRLGRFGIWH